MASNVTPKKTDAPARSSFNRPVDMFTAMRMEMDRMFDRFHHGWPQFPGLTGSAGSAMVLPSLDLKDTGNAIVVEAELPGVDEKDVTLTVKDGVLTIKGEKRGSNEEKGENHYVTERSYGRFLRSLQLPESIDEGKVEARFDKGVLTITAEKRPGAAMAEKRIEIRKS